MFKIKVCSPLDPANPLYYRHIIYLHNICKREAGSRGLGLGLGHGGGAGAIFSKPMKVCGQNTVGKKYT